MLCEFGTDKNMKKNVLLEMPWATGAKCPYCDFKFGFDGRIEGWTPSKEANRKYLEYFFKIKQLPLECPNCNKLILHDFVKTKTFKYDEIIDRTKPSIRRFFHSAIRHVRPFLKIGVTVIPENKQKTPDRLTFQAFVEGQSDK